MCCVASLLGWTMSYHKRQLSIFIFIFSKRLIFAHTRRLNLQIPTVLCQWQLSTSRRLSTTKCVWALAELEKDNKFTKVGLWVGIDSTVLGQCLLNCERNGFEFVGIIIKGLIVSNTDSICWSFRFHFPITVLEVKLLVISINEFIDQALEVHLSSAFLTQSNTRSFYTNGQLIILLWYSFTDLLDTHLRNRLFCLSPPQQQQQLHWHFLFYVNR